MSPESDLKVRTGKIFEIGSYPDKAFSFDQTDLERAVSSFAPVPVDLEHTPTVLEGKLGHVQRIYPGDDGKSLMGEVHLPAWLDSLLTDGERKVSATWDRATKQLKGLALVRSPRVSDAALMAAFAKHNTPSGQSVIQMMHDVAASGGAVCNKPAAMHARHEANAIQQMHDTAVEHGATCQSMQPGQTMPIATYAKSPRSTRMNLKEWMLGKAQEDGIELEDVEAAFSNAPDPAVAEMQAKLKAAEDRAAALEKAQETHAATFARLETERRESAAATFAKDQVIAGRISPAAQAPLAALTVRILAADSTATFAEGEKSNTALLKEVLDALESDFKVFTKNTVGDDAGPFAALFAETKTKGVGEPEARNEILKKMRDATPQGRALAKETQA